MRLVSQTLAMISSGCHSVQGLRAPAVAAAEPAAATAAAVPTGRARHEAAPQHPGLDAVAMAMECGMCTLVLEAHFPAAAAAAADGANSWKVC
mmetsp:Transcript_84351/g.212729  ORF Transcript_84351/g.212729 Transcript_84351/m.212729 type:complete len:93 (+) Transcript_84351:515-793(+)